MNNATSNLANSWVNRLPNQAACFLITILLVYSQWNPCDTVLGIAHGDSLTMMVLCMATGFLVALDIALVQKEPDHDRSTIRLLLLAMVVPGCIWFSTYQQLGSGNGRYSLNGCWQWISQIVLMLSIIRLCQTKTIASSWIELMLSLAAGSVAITLYQYLYTLPNDRMEFAKNPAGFLSSVGVIPGSTEAMLYANRLGSLEPSGPFALTNSLGGFLVPWIVMTIALIVQGWGESPTRPRKQATLAWLFAILFLFGFAMWLTRSRSAILAAGIGAIAVILFVPWVRKKFVSLIQAHLRIFVVTASCIAFLIALVSFREPRLFTEASKSLSYRLEYWQGAIQIIKANSMFGVGTCNFQSRYAQVKPIMASETPADPHNFLVETACSGGVPLLLLLLVSIMVIAWRATSGPPSCNNLNARKGIANEEKQRPNWRVLIAIGAMVTGVAIVAFYYLANDNSSLIAATLYLAVGCLTWLGLKQFGPMTNMDQLKPIYFVASSSLLLHLCFSGGWMTPGLMNSIFILVGVSLRRSNSTTEVSKILSPTPMPIVLRSSLVRFLPLALVCLASADFFRTTARPVLGATEAFAELQQGASSKAAEEWLTMTELDPWDPELPRLAANQCVQVLSRRNLSVNEKRKWLSAFDSLSAEFIRRDPNHWTAASECGRWHMLLGDSGASRLPVGESDDETKKHKEASFVFFNKAADLYPVSAPCQLQAAVASAWVGNWENCKERVVLADTIDKTTPHLDRKIQAGVVLFPFSLESNAMLGPAARQDLESGSARGEPVANWLRTRSE